MHPGEKRLTIARQPGVCLYRPGVAEKVANKWAGREGEVPALVEWRDLAEVSQQGFRSAASAQEGCSVSTLAGCIAQDWVPRLWHERVARADALRRAGSKSGSSAK